MINIKFEEWLTLQGLRENTVKEYCNRVKLFLEKVSIQNINEETVKKYFIDLRKSHSQNTYNNQLIGISKFLDFLKLKIELPKSLKPESKIPRKIEEEFFENEIMDVVDSIFQNPFKIKVILYFMFYTGIRLREVCNLKRDNIDLKNRVAIVKQKGGNEKFVFFTDKIKEMLEQYFQLETEDINAFNIQYHNLRQKFWLINKYLDGINFRPHALRHAFGTLANERNINDSLLQRLMGHKDKNSTAIYLHPSIEKMRDIYDTAFNNKRKNK